MKLLANRQSMRSGEDCRVARYGNGAVLYVALALLLAGPVCADAGAVGQTQSAASPPGHHVQRMRAEVNLDGRMALLSKELELDVYQQGEVRKILEAQREQVRKVWSDASVPAGYRVVATRAIGDRTADRIRGLLTDEQRKKYIQPRPPTDALAGSAQPNVEAWMDATKAK